jgi:membrane peptidoglycan carboxypeptidase
MKGEEFTKAGALENEKNWNGENAGLVAIDPKTGQILTMVGSRDYFDKAIDGNYNIATAHRQPGSSFKPFIYATAFNEGFTPSTVLFDVPTEFQTTCDAYGKALPGHSQSDCYMPDDYDGLFRGPMTLRNALAQSINIPAVKLFYLVGLGNALKTAEDMGISTLVDKSRYGLTLVIGGGEVTLLDMTSSYGVFADDGIRNPYTGILKVEDNKGNLLEEYTPKEQEVLPKNTALTISDILSDNTARIPTFGANSPLVVPGKEVAVKTGTTNSNKDAWIIGYTPSISVGVWAGNNDNTAMKKGGAALAGPIWNKFMVEALKTLPNEKFEKPDLSVDPEKVKPVLRGSWQGNETFFIDKFSGKLATADTPPESVEEKVVTNVHSILYWVDRKNITGPPPTNPADDPQFNQWEIPVQKWWAEHKANYQTITLDQKPVGEDDVHTDASKPNVEIVEPSKLQIYSPDQRIQLKVSSTGYYPLQKIDIFINDTYLGTSQAPFNFSFIPKDLDDLREQNEIKIISYDSVYNRAETNSTFKVRQ